MTGRIAITNLDVLKPVFSAQTPLRVLCTGYRSGGGYAELCGVWAAVTYPGANVRTITFGAPEVRRMAIGFMCCS